MFGWLLPVTMSGRKLQLKLWHDYNETCICHSQLIDYSIHTDSRVERCTACTAIADTDEIAIKASLNIRLSIVDVVLRCCANYSKL